MGQIFSSVEAVNEFLNSSNLNKTLVLRDGKKISYAEIGPNHKRTLFILPGISGNRVCIESCAYFLSKSDIRVILVDWPGYGESTIIKQRSLKSYCDYFEQILDLLLPDKTEKFALYGVSAGCIHISQIIIDERFKSRVVCAILTSPWPSPRAEGVDDATRELSQLPGILARKNGREMFNGSKAHLTSNTFEDGMKGELTSAEINYLQAAWKLNESAWKIFMNRFFEVSTVDGFLANFHLCFEHFHDIDFDLNKIHPETSVHVYYGDNDKTSPAEAVEAFYRNPITATLLSTNFKFNKIAGGTHDGVPFTQMQETMNIIIGAFSNKK